MHVSFPSAHGEVEHEIGGCIITFVSIGVFPLFSVASYTINYSSVTNASCFYRLSQHHKMAQNSWQLHILGQLCGLGVASVLVSAFTWNRMAEC
uniref:Uncharacterized protein n=1 Tax=Manihot esculenta TaxID=3983 RepID=A0A2C9WB22_MANES